MADIKISALPAAAALTGVEAAPVVQSAATVKTTSLAIAQLLLAQLNTFTANGAVSAPVTVYTGNVFTGGTGTTTLPFMLFQTAAATAAATWATGGTYIGINSNSGFAGNFLDFRVNGGSVFSITSTSGSIFASGRIQSLNAGVASFSALSFTGALFTGGTGTTTLPQYLAQTSTATATTSWSTAGTYIGINTNTGFTGNFLDFHVNGGSAIFNITSSGTVFSAGKFVTTFAAPGSASVYQSSGTLLTGGTGTTNQPQWFSQTSAATAVTTWSTNGTYFGVNANSGFTGNFSDYRINGGVSLFAVNANGAVMPGTAQTVVSGSSSGNATYSQPFAGTSYKKVIVYCATLVGTAAYVFPTAFTQTPQIMATNGPAAAVVTSLSTTGVTVTGATTTGFIILEGY